MTGNIELFINRYSFMFLFLFSDSVNSSGHFTEMFTNVIE